MFRRPRMNLLTAYSISVLYAKSLGGRNSTAANWTRFGPIRKSAFPHSKNSKTWIAPLSVSANKSPAALKCDLLSCEEISECHKHILFGCSDSALALSLSGCPPFCVDRLAVLHCTVGKCNLVYLCSLIPNRRTSAIHCLVCTLALNSTAPAPYATKKEQTRSERTAQSWMGRIQKWSRKEVELKLF